MKHTIKSLTALPLALSLLISCQSADKKEEAAENKVEAAQENLEEVRTDIKNDAIKTANAEEWAAFKKESENQISANEDRITTLKHKIKNKDKVLEKMYEERIESLEKTNMEMRNRIDAYEKNHSDWESFKREYKHDMDELGKSLKDFGVNNQK